MKLSRILINITIPIFIVMLFASFLTTKGYLLLSKGLYESHDAITYDYDYAADRIMGYLNYRYDDLLFGATPDDTTVIMRQIELDHMKDVKDLYTMLRLVALGSLLIGGGLIYYQYKKDPKELYITLKWMPTVPVAFVGIVGSAVLIDFSAAFTAFHQIFFTNDDWQLLPTDVLIMLLPQNFWMVSGVLILLFFSTTIAGIYILNEKILKRRLN